MIINNLAPMNRGLKPVGSMLATECLLPINNLAPMNRGLKLHLTIPYVQPYLY